MFSMYRNRIFVTLGPETVLVHHSGNLEISHMNFTRCDVMQLFWINVFTPIIKPILVNLFIILLFAWTVIIDYIDIDTIFLDT